MASCRLQLCHTANLDTSALLPMLSLGDVSHAVGVNSVTSIQFSTRCVPLKRIWVWSVLSLPQKVQCVLCKCITSAMSCGVQKLGRWRT